MAQEFKGFMNEYVAEEHSRGKKRLLFGAATLVVMGVLGYGGSTALQYFDRERLIKEITPKMAAIDGRPEYSADDWSILVSRYRLPADAKTLEDVPLAKLELIAKSLK